MSNYGDLSQGLMDCLKGNVRMDLNMQVPSEHKKPVFARLAEIHVRRSGRFGFLI